MPATEFKEPSLGLTGLNGLLAGLSSSEGQGPMDCLDLPGPQEYLPCDGYLMA